MSPDNDRMVFTQYRAFGQQHTTVTCGKHESILLAELRRAGIGSGSSFAPSLARCDRCENAQEDNELWAEVWRLRTALADPEPDVTATLHGPGCVDCRNGVTDFHRSRTDRPNPLREPDVTEDGDGA